MHNTHKKISDLKYKYEITFPRKLSLKVNFPKFKVVYGFVVIYT